MEKIHRALLSVYDKTGLDQLAAGLIKHDIQIISTGNTANYLRQKGIEVEDISSVTSFPEILDGRVKTLHPVIHSGILFRRDHQQDREILGKLNIEPIDLVVVNLYPFQKVKDSGAPEEEIIENIDIGGPTLLRAAAKNFKFVTVVCNPGEYSNILAELEENDGAVTLQTRKRLAGQVFNSTNQYDAAIDAYFREDKEEGELPGDISIQLSREMELRYGENPHQKAAIYSISGQNASNSLLQAEKLVGKKLSFNNFTDAEGAINLLAEFERPAAVIVKHANPCGVAVSKDGVTSAFERALEGDKVSAFGGIVAVNRPVDIELAKQLHPIFLEVIIAPDYTPEALEKLRKKKKRRILKMPNLNHKPNISNRLNLEYRYIKGGMLAQEVDQEFTPVEQWEQASGRKPSPKEMKDLQFAWKVAKHVKSNAIVLVRDEMLIGVGAGQMSRVDSVIISCRKAGQRTDGAVMASDAFFPFNDGVLLAQKAGITAVVQPGGSVRDKEVIEAVDQHNMTMLFTGRRHFRH